MYYIGSNCELSTYDDNLRIGVGNFRREEYIGEQGTRREGFSAVLWLTVGDGSVPPQTVRVHAGQEVAFSEYWVRVVEVDRSDEGTYFVRVAIGEVGEPGEGSPGD